MTFWTGAGIILLVVLTRFLWISLRTPRAPTRTATDVYQAQREALALAAADGEIAAAHLPGLEHELARATLQDAARERAAPRPPSQAERYGLSLLVLLLLPAVTVPVYLKFGSPNPPGADPANHLSAPEMVSQLQARIDRAPNDPEPRLWLARVYMASGQYAEAVRVFEALNALVPDQPAVLLQYADALAMTHNGVLAGKATELIHRALVLEPENVTGLWLAGVAADEAGRAPEALAYLRRARQASATTELPTAELDALISEVETRSRLKIEAVAGRATVKGVPVAAGIAVNVKVDQALVADLPPDTVVFVLAKALNGPPMPLAVKRLSLRELPLTITLDDSLAMAPQFKLSTADQVMVTARISRGGEPIAHAGDIEGTAGPLRVGIDTSVNITINAVIH